MWSSRWPRRLSIHSGGPAPGPARVRPRGAEPVCRAAVLLCALLLFPVQLESCFALVVAALADSFCPPFFPGTGRCGAQVGAGRRGRAGGAGGQKDSAAGLRGHRPEGSGSRAPRITPRSSDVSSCAFRGDVPLKQKSVPRSGGFSLCVSLLARSVRVSREVGLTPDEVQKRAPLPARGPAPVPLPPAVRPCCRLCPAVSAARHEEEALSLLLTYLFIFFPAHVSRK